MLPRVTSKVYADLEMAMDYYSREASPQIAREFYDEFQRCRRIIGRFPYSYPIVRGNIRRINFRRFPYHLLYEVTDEERVRLLIVKHDRRDPDFGLNR